jgi:hypothetical protein
MDDDATFDIGLEECPLTVQTDLGVGAVVLDLPRAGFMLTASVERLQKEEAING